MAADMLRKKPTILSLRMFTSAQDPQGRLYSFRVDGQKRYENDVKTIVWTENILVIYF